MSSANSCNSTALAYSSIVHAFPYFFHLHRRMPLPWFTHFDLSSQPCRNRHVIPNSRLGLFAAWNYLAVPFKTTLNPVYLEIYSSNPRSANAVHSQRAAFVPLTCPMELTGQKHGSQGGDSCGTKRLNFYRFNIICKIR